MRVWETARREKIGKNEKGRICPRKEAQMFLRQLWEKDLEGSARWRKTVQDGGGNQRQRLSPGVRERSYFKPDNFQREIRVLKIRNAISWHFPSQGTPLRGQLAECEHCQSWKMRGGRCRADLFAGSGFCGGRHDY